VSSRHLCPRDRRALLARLARAGMHGRGRTRFARIALALGVLGVALHASLVAWFPCARSWTQTADQSVLAELQSVICHGGEANAAPSPASQEPPSSPDPGKDCLSCLFCQAKADTWFAIVASMGLSTPSEFSTAFSGPASDDAFVASPVLEPRSRGPPRLV
jgi:hypothetical protein